MPPIPDPPASAAFDSLASAGGTTKGAASCDAAPFVLRRTPDTDPRGAASHVVGIISAMRTIAVVSPGAMGSAIGRGYASGGARVVATVQGRSARTAGLAHGLELLPSLQDVVAVADLVISVVPPGEALGTVRAIRAAADETGVRPVVADFNAVSPATMSRIAQVLDGFEVVDGSISGAPPDAGTTRLYLSGDQAEEVAQLHHPHLAARVVAGGVGAASAVKMSTASVRKGTWAVLLQAVMAAEAAGVLDVVLDDLAPDYPELVAGLPAGLASSASKSGRFVAEMLEIADTQASTGWAPELFEGMAAVWERVAQTELGHLSPEQVRELTSLPAVVEALAPPS
jgi:3-hydroxyisobutyrate dehydrogenase-like beta-hydroxyacid dehydrogenase